MNHRSLLRHIYQNWKIETKDATGTGLSGGLFLYMEGGVQPGSY